MSCFCSCVSEMNAGCYILALIVVYFVELLLISKLIKICIILMNAGVVENCGKYSRYVRVQKLMTTVIDLKWHLLTFIGLRQQDLSV